jgi:hypothetical protein
MTSAIASARTLVQQRAIMAPDTWERHLIVAELLGSPVRVLDVGGLPGQLDSFLPDSSVLAVNVTPPADLIVDRDGLPFKDATFPGVTSLDVLEHIPPGDRRRFVHEMLRVCGGRLVLCCPLGSPEHTQAEEEVHAWYRERSGEDHPWLEEHLSLGLPTLPELQAIFAEHDGPVRFAFHGDWRVVIDQFRLLMTARFGLKPADLLRYARFRLPYEPQTTLDDAPTPYTNRVYVVADTSG